MMEKPAADRSPGALPDIASRPSRPWWAVWLLRLAAVVLAGALLALGAAVVYYDGNTCRAYSGGRWRRPISASGTMMTESEVAERDRHV